MSSVKSGINVFFCMAGVSISNSVPRSKSQVKSLRMTCASIIWRANECVTKWYLLSGKPCFPLRPSPQQKHTKSILYINPWQCLIFTRQPRRNPRPASQWRFQIVISKRVPQRYLKVSRDVTTPSLFWIFWKESTLLLSLWENTHSSNYLLFSLSFHLSYSLVYNLRPFLDSEGMHH